MSPLILRKYHDSVAFATGCKRIKNSKRCNRKIRIPIAVWPCRVEEKMALKEVDGQTVEEIETKIIAKDGTITRVPRKFQGYETSEEEPVEQPRRHDLYGFVDHPQLQQGNPMNEFAPHRLPQPKGNMNDGDYEYEKKLRGMKNCGGGNGNGGNNGCTFKASQSCNPKEYDGKGGAIVLTHWIEKMENMIDNSVVAEKSKRIFMIGQGGSWKDNKKAKVGTGFVATAPPRNEVTNSNPKCSKCNMHHPVTGPLQYHFRNTYPKMNRAPGQAGNQLALEGSRNNQSNGNQVRGRAYNVNVNAMEAVQDPNVVTGHRSFDVIVGMDWLSQHKAVIVCHEKVVEIPVMMYDPYDVYLEELVMGYAFRNPSGVFHIDLVLE
ncbi:putative reverse transcriptase domain-containing protein [Tanacetum coccineum]